MFHVIFTISVLFIFGVKSQINFPGASVTSSPSTAIQTSDLQNFQFFLPLFNITSSYIQADICQCVPTGKCSQAGGTSNSIDIRIVNGGSSGSSSSSTTTSIASSGITPIISSQSSCASGLELCCPNTGYSCGIQYSPYSSAPSVSGTQGE
jgi:hypothetical protein